VLINHVLESKIDFEVVFPGLQNNNIECFKCVSELLHDLDYCEAIFSSLLHHKNYNVLDSILKGIEHESEELSCLSINIVGSLLSSKNEQNISKFTNDRLVLLLCRRL
jgi:hypothetical protein